MKTPKLVMLLTSPLTCVPIGYFSSISDHGFGSICFMPSEILRLPSSTSSTIASTMSPRFTSFEGCFTRLVHDISEMWTSPSMPGSSSTKAP